MRLLISAIALVALIGADTTIVGAKAQTSTTAPGSPAASPETTPAPAAKHTGTKKTTHKSGKHSAKHKTSKKSKTPKSSTS